MAVLAEVNTLATASSALLSEQIAAVIPGGVDSPFRSFQEVGGHTIFLNKAEGAYVYDVDGNRYVDFLGAWGPAILGHCPKQVVSACQLALAQGPVFGAPCTLELQMAQSLIGAYSAVEMVRFVNSGTEAVMSAVRLARGYTGRDLIVMFEGCYHGHSDAVLASRDHVASSGVPQAVSANTVRVPYNNPNALADVLAELSGKVAAVLIEPVAGSMGVVPPEPGYLQIVRDLCTRYETLLIFDEVLTGLRIARGGANELYSVNPDIACFGKALGGGMPIGAYGASAKIMEELQPIGKVYQAGTFSGNPVTMAGGIETLKLLSAPGVYERLEALADQLFEGLSLVLPKLSFPLQLQRVGSMFALLFAPQPVLNYQDSLSIDNERYAKFFRGILSQGVYMPPSAVDAACLSLSHTTDDIDYAVRVMTEVLIQL